VASIRFNSNASGYTILGLPITFSGDTTISTANTVGTNTINVTLNQQQFMGQLNHVFDVASGGTLQIGGEITGAPILNGVHKTGPGELELLNGANDHGGDTTIDGGSLRVGSTRAVPSTSAVTVAAGAPFDLNNHNEIIGSLTGPAGASVTLGTADLTTGVDNTSTTFSGVISGAGRFFKNGTGTFTLGGVNTYTGGTYIRAGGPLQLGVNFAVPAGALGLIEAGARFNLNNHNEILNSLTGPAGSSVTLGTGALTLNVQNNSTAFDGVISGAGLLSVNDQGTTTAKTYTLTATAVTRSGGPTINYGSLGSLILNGGSGGNTFNIESTAAGTATTVEAGTGNDTVSISPSATNLNTIQGAVTINGNSGSDTLVVNDQFDTADQTDSLTATALNRSGVAISFASMSTVTFNGGSGGQHHQRAGNAGRHGGQHQCRGGQRHGQRGQQRQPAEHPGPRDYSHRSSGRLSITVDDRNDTISQAPVLSEPRGYDLRSDYRPGPWAHLLPLREHPPHRVDGDHHGPCQRAGDGHVHQRRWERRARHHHQRGQRRQRPTDPGPTTLSNPAGPLMVNANDQNDPAAQPGITLETVTQGDDFILLHNLAPAPIFSVANQTVAFVVNGGSGGNTFRVRGLLPGATLALDGGSGTNTLDYTAYAGNVLVNLPRGEATGFSSLSNIQNVTGASGGPAGSYNVLIGNGGNVLTGGNGRRNLLVAGSTASTLIGGNDDDILIAGTTDYDTSDQWQAAFTAIMNEWTQMTDYATRVDHLMNGGGLNGPYLLNAATVHSNGGGNTLTGHGGGANELNLYFANLDLGDTTDQDPGLGEQLIPIV
jgi:autotransporter-associated beta strand protein